VAAALLGVALGCGSGNGPAPPDAAADAAADRPVDAGVDAPPDLAADAAADTRPDAAPDAAPDLSRPDAPPPASFVLSPDMFDFQTVPVGMSRSHVFQLKNTGGQISGTPSISLTGGSPDMIFLIIDNQCETSLEPEASCPIEVQFTPMAAGAQGVLLEAEAAPGGRVSSQLDGTGQ
jgi:hypothetical protein